MRKPMIWSVRIMNLCSRKWSTTWWCCTKLVYQVSYLYFFIFECYAIFIIWQSNVASYFKYSASHFARFWECDKDWTPFKNFNLNALYCSIIKVSSKIAFLSRTLVLLEIFMRLLLVVMEKPFSSTTSLLCFTVCMVLF